jgi:ABC-2 type transport system permease protein
MTTPIVRQLVAKDLFLARWILFGSTAAGVVSIAVAPLSPVMFYVGSISLICVLIALNVFLVLHGVTQERKDKVLLFVLSLPISTLQYTRTKMMSTLIAFFFPWLLLTTFSLVVMEATSLPNGLMPFALATLLYLLCYHCLLLGVGLVAESAGWATAAIVFGNVSVNFFIPLVFRLPSAGPNVSTETALWGPDLITVFILEIVFCVVVLALSLILCSRKKSFI